jgi:hypothetical protein
MACYGVDCTFRFTCVSRSLISVNNYKYLEAFTPQKSTQSFALAGASNGLKTRQCIRDGLLNSPRAFYTARIILKYLYKSKDIKSMQFRKIEVCDVEETY